MATGGGARASVEDVSVDATETGATATAAFRLTADGLLQQSLNGGTYTGIGTWLTPTVAALAALYECRMTILSGAPTSGTTGSWLALTADRTWTLTKAVAGSSAIDMTLEIRLASTGSVMTSSTISMSATYV